jgi:hypothetical protein
MRLHLLTHTGPKAVATMLLTRTRVKLVGEGGKFLAKEFPKRWWIADYAQSALMVQVRIDYLGHTLA